jgi:hypothetical protein
MVSSNTLTNIKMTNAIKGIVSKKKKRYKEGGYDLDLTCKYMNFFALYKGNLKKYIRDIRRVFFVYKM